MANTLALSIPTPPTIVEPEITYVASCVPAQVIHESGTTLFRVAMQQFGDALQWGTLAALNGILDPWILALTDIRVPPVAPTKAADGIYRPIAGPSIASQLVPTLVGSLTPQNLTPQSSITQSTAQPMGMP